MMNRDEQIGRMILEASTGMHGDIARDLAQAWCNLAEKKQGLQSHLEELSQKVDELEKDCCQLIDDRDERDEVIDALLIQVLGNECKEWSSAYDFNDAVIDVECKMKSLEKEAARWNMVLYHVGADNSLGGAQYVIRGIKTPINVMRGAVSQHFVESIDAAMQASNQ